MELDKYVFRGALTRRFRKHLEATDVPQTYDQHKAFAASHSWGMIVAGVKGLIHSINPNAYPFDGSTTIIRSFEKMVLSGRHIGEIKEYMPGYLYPQFLDIEYLKTRKKSETEALENLGDK